jgi:hypothetical protein
LTGAAGQREAAEAGRAAGGCAADIAVRYRARQLADCVHRGQSVASRAAEAGGAGGAGGAVGDAAEGHAEAPREREARVAVLAGGRAVADLAARNRPSAGGRAGVPAQGEEGLAGGTRREAGAGLAVGHCARDLYAGSAGEGVAGLAGAAGSGGGGGADEAVGVGANGGAEGAREDQRVPSVASTADAEGGAADAVGDSVLGAVEDALAADHLVAGDAAATVIGREAVVAVGVRADRVAGHLRGGQRIPTGAGGAEGGSPAGIAEGDIAGGSGARIVCVHIVPRATLIAFFSSRKGVACYTIGSCAV